VSSVAGRPHDQDGGEAFSGVWDGVEHDVGPPGGVDQVADQPGRDRAVAEAAPVGVAAVDGREQRGESGGLRTACPADPHGRQVGGVLRVREAEGRGLQSLVGQRDHEVAQCCSAADQQVAAVRIGGGELPAPVGEQLDHAVGGVDAPPPRLGVVHRRRPEGVLDGLVELR
jgi:hypothetical protein